MNIVKPPDTEGKLSILARDSQYDLACACGTKENGDHRQRAGNGAWLYPVSLPDGGKSILLKTLLSNYCVNDCGYCPLRAGRDVERCTLDPEKLVRLFLEYYRSGQAMGLFLSSGVIGTPDNTMQRINEVARILRLRERFPGYIHLKVIPGASDAAIEESVSLANAVSVNIETPGEKHFAKVCSKKNYLDGVIRSIKLVHTLTEGGDRWRRVKQTTQFIVGASDETDHEIVRYSWGLYRRLDMQRIYFSAYQRGLGRSDLPGENSSAQGEELLTREHRLYQVDWLMRKYGFTDEEIPFGGDGNLSLTVDPKENWARLHPEFFPVDLNRADRLQLLRVPGLGPKTVARVLLLRRAGGRIHRLEELGRVGKLLTKASAYVKT